MNNIYILYIQYLYTHIVIHKKSKPKYYIHRLGKSLAHHSKLPGRGNAVRHLQIGRLRLLGQ